MLRRRSGWAQLLLQNHTRNRRHKLRRETVSAVTTERLESRTLLTVFVDCNAPVFGNNDGSSWKDAYVDLQDGLQHARYSGQDVHVADGVYYPGNASTDTFELFPGLQLQGGFPGYYQIAGTPDRDWTFHQTILSGDLNQDDVRVYYDSQVDTYGVEGLLMNIQNNEENCFTIVTGSDDALIEGFYIESGRAVPGPPAPGTAVTPQMSEGGGMYNNHASPQVQDVVFRWNAAVRGGGMANIASDPDLSRVVFDGNLANELGGGLFNSESTPQLVNTVFYKNHVTETQRAYGGALANMADSDATIRNSTFYGNWAPAGGAMANLNSDPILVNDILYGNGAITQGGTSEIFDDASSTPFVAYTDIGGPYLSSGNPGYNNCDHDPIFWAPDGSPNPNAAAPDYGGEGPDQRWATADDGLQLDSNPDNFSHEIDTGTLIQALPNSTIMVSPSVDIIGNPRPTLFQMPPGQVDKGAYEHQADAVDDFLEPAGPRDLTQPRIGPDELQRWSEKVAWDMLPRDTDSSHRESRSPAQEPNDAWKRQFAQAHTDWLPTEIDPKHPVSSALEPVSNDQTQPAGQHGRQAEADLDQAWLELVAHDLKSKLNVF